MNKLIKGVFNENEGLHYENIFNQLGNITSSELRKELLNSMINQIDTRKIINGIQDILMTSPDEVLKNTSISGAGMLKIKLLSHLNGEIRIHIFNKTNSDDNILRDIEVEPHIHDFQGFSKVLYGKVVEQKYRFEKMSVKDRVVYTERLRNVKTLSESDQQKLSTDLEVIHHGNLDISNQDIANICDKNGFDIAQISQMHTIYDSIKVISGNSVTEHFKQQGMGKFIDNGIREIQMNETYFLPAEQGHKILNQDEVVTFFVSDTTYTSLNNQKQNGVILRGHGVRFPWQQILTKSRSVINRLSSKQLQNELEKI